MKSILFSAAALLLLGFAHAAEEFYVQTEKFGDFNFHQTNTLDSYSRGGLIAGWIIYGIMVVVSFVLVFKSTLDRSREYD